MPEHAFLLRFFDGHTGRSFRLIVRGEEVDVERLAYDLQFRYPRLGINDVAILSVAEARELHGMDLPDAHEPPGRW